MSEDPYEGIEALGLPAIVTGWPNQRDGTIAHFASCSGVIVEVGSFLGRSAIIMARASPHAIIYAVDTWLGSPEIPIDKDTTLQFGRPNYYERFLTNMIAAGISDRVVPICQTSLAGAVMLKRRKVVADMVYLDAGHTYIECYNDLLYYSHILADDGVIVGDDYDWPSVAAAAERFAYESRMQLIDRGDGKFVLKATPQMVRTWPGLNMGKLVELIAQRPVALEP